MAGGVSFSRKTHPVQRSRPVMLVRPRARMVYRRILFRIFRWTCIVSSIAIPNAFFLFMNKKKALYRGVGGLVRKNSEQNIYPIEVYGDGFPRKYNCSHQNPIERLYDGSRFCVQSQIKDLSLLIGVIN